MADGSGFREGIQWGYGYGMVTEREVRKPVRGRGGFNVKSAEIKDGSVVVKAVNTCEGPLTVKSVGVVEIYPEPQEKTFGIFASKKKGEKLQCEWRVLGFNLVNPQETVDIEVKPSRPLKDGYAYIIAVGRQLSMKEEEAIMQGGSPHVGIPAAYLYRNGKMEKPQASMESPTVEKRFCIGCGVEIPPSATYCPICGEKQEFETSCGL